MSEHWDAYIASHEYMKNLMEGYTMAPIQGPGGESAVDRWRRLFLEGKIDAAELEERLGPAIEYDEKQELP